MSDEFRALFDANPRPMFVFDRDTLGFLLVNDAACALYEWSREQLLAMTLRDVRLPEDVPRLERAIADARALPKLPQITSRHLTRSGKVLDVVVDMTRVNFRERNATLAVVQDVTHANEAERRLRLFVDNARDGISLVDTEGRVAYMSPGGERMLGFKPGEWLGRRATDNMHPDDIATYQPVPPGEARLHVSRARHTDGTWRWIEVMNLNLTLDPAIRGHVANFRDVTTRVEAERAAEDARRRLEHLLSVTSAITYSAKVEGGVTFISASVREVLGYEPSAFFQPGFWLSAIHPDDRPSVDAKVRDILGGGVHRFEYRLRHADGSYRWILDEARVVPSPDGDRRELVGYMIDVTERKHAEEAMRRSEGQFRALIEHSPMLILIHRHGKVIYVNPAAVEALGWTSADELVGMSVIELVHPDDRDGVRARMEHTSQHGGGAPGEARMRRRDGSYVVTEGEGILLDFDGEPASVVVGQDVTERRELFSRIALADRLLSVGTLAAGVAHEINNPLAYVSSNLELLERELPLLLSGQRSNVARDEVEELLADARDGAERVGAIVRDLRALSRTEDNVRGPVDIVAVLTSCIKMANNEIRHRARVVSSFAADLPLARGNASRLGQVFLNLLVNAAQAIPEGRANENEIRVRASAQPDRGEVVVEIEDTGAGIPRSVIDRIFDPFFTTKPVGLGTGLGLSISHEIVRSLGGRIEVDSAVGVGTTFRVVLPVAAAAMASDELAELPASPNVARVLVIDDEAAVGRSIALLLAPDYDVTPVTRAHEALARITAGERFDAIVCDVMMPEMSGIEFFEQLSCTVPEATERVVFLTGGAFTAQARDFLASAHRPQLEKPFTEVALRRAIEAMRARSASP